MLARMNDIILFRSFDVIGLNIGNFSLVVVVTFINN